MTTLEILVAARAKISTPDKWCKGQPATDITGWPCVADSPTAYRWCVLGALILVCKRNMEAVRQAALCLGGGVVQFNDALTTMHADILALFDRAIAAQPQPARGEVPMEGA